MQIDTTYEHLHYADHILPVFRALPKGVRGTDHGLKGWCEDIDRPLLLAGYSDANRNPQSRYIFMEHGAGQSYLGSSNPMPWYSGGEGHRRALGFICPNQEVADRWLARYPNKPVAVVGCPRLDRWHLNNCPEPKTAAITFHWPADFTGVQETSSAFSYYIGVIERAIAVWRTAGWTILGHSHPRYASVVLPYWASIGVEVVKSADEVLDRASVLLADNTSLQAEFLSLRRPVVFLNCPAYRKEVVHGGRFWQWTEQGTQIDRPNDLTRLDLDTLPVPTWHPYAFADGCAAERAAQFVSQITN